MPCTNAERQTSKALSCQMQEVLYDLPAALKDFYNIFMKNNAF